ncbi:4Fe-4S dicluster domain-containing protein [Geitlerinema splendidum]|nr:4Fe-4S dicluster domain-containing protein [Geitlerinema splendidum]
MAGASMPAGMHALACAANEALGALGGVVTYRPYGEDAGASSTQSIRDLAGAMGSGAVETLVVIGCNPVFDAPADLEFAAKYTRVPTTVHLGENLDETAVASTWHVNRAHYLESWGDVSSWDGTISAVQPMIAPIFGGKTELELLGAVVGDEERDGYGMVRRTWREMTGLRGEAFEKAWKRALHDGFMAGSAPRAATPSVKRDGVASAARGVSVAGGEMEAVFLPDAKLWDGRYANNGWLQELPHPTTKVTWDNPAMLSPATAERLGVKNTDTVEVTVGGRTMRLVAWIVPGLSDGTVALELGQGRATGGRLCVGTGFNTYAVRGSDAPYLATSGVSVRRASGSAADRAYAGVVATTQDHHSMEGRPIIREIDLAAWKKHGDTVFVSKDSYGNKRTLALGEQLGDMTHTPVNRDVYLERQRHSYRLKNPVPGQNERQRQVYPTGLQQWGMSIDLTTCTGCGACVTACQSENNIPVIGKAEVWKGREMHWIRVDRYFAGGVDDPEMVVQPVNCMHCENAPCETVCPVNATIHGPEGTNDMAYNRCIGTRYCANNCPYKVRRFNWFDYATKDFKGGFGQWGKGLPSDLMPKNEALVPPRLRAEISELETLQRNPNVTVRSRGVMEKCTYCLQRINRARVETKAQDLKGIPDGFFEVACQQACPSESIVFGDISDPASEASALRSHGRTYALLGYLNTVPRTTYMIRLRNPNPRIRKPVEDPPALHHGEEGGDHGGAKGGHGEGHADGTKRLSLPVLGSAPADASRRGAVASVLAGVLS